MQIQKYPTQDEIRPEKAGKMTRLAKCLASGASVSEQLAAAERFRAAPVVVNVIKAAESEALLSDNSWAGVLSYDQISADFIRSIGPGSVFYMLAGLNGIETPLEKRVAVSTVTGPKATALSEGAPIPVTSAELAGNKFSSVLTGGIVVLSDELLNSTDGEAFDFLRNELQLTAIHSIDETALGIITAGTTPLTATSGEPITDLRRMLDVVNQRGAGSLLWACAPNVANVLATLEDQRMPMSPRGGTVLNIPVVVSDSLADGRIVLMDSSGFAVNQGVIAIDRSKNATLQMDNAPTEGAAEMVSLWQSNMTALRLIARFGLTRLRDNAVAVLDGAATNWVA